MRRYTIEVGSTTYMIDVEELAADRFQVLVDDQRFDVRLSADENLTVEAITPEMAPAKAAPIAYRPPAPESLPPPPSTPPPALPSRSQLTPGQSSRVLTAPMPGTIISIAVAPGDTVTHGQPLLVLEAMKMKNTIRAAHDATVAKVLIQPGQTVGFGTELLLFEQS